MQESQADEQKGKCLNRDAEFDSHPEMQLLLQLQKLLLSSGRAERGNLDLHSLYQKKLLKVAF